MQRDALSVGTDVACYRKTSDASAVARTREELVDKFGGVTAYSRSPAEGIWTSPGGDHERDAVLMVEVLTEQFDRAWWRAYQHLLAERFAQEEIHIRAIETHTP